MSLYRKMKKTVDVKIFAVAIIASIFVPLILMGTFDPMAGFGIADEQGEFKFAGVSYNGRNYLSTSTFPGEVIIWKSHTMYVDPDGALNHQDRTDLTPDDLVEPIYETGTKPGILFTLSDTLQLVNLDGNPLSGGYTRKVITIDGYDQYIYHYKTKLTMQVKMDWIDGAPVEESWINTQAYFNQMPYSPDAGVYPHIFWDDGKVVWTAGMCEIGVVDNIYALMTINFPEVENWEFGWEADVNNVGAVLTYLQNGAQYSENQIDDFTSKYVESLAPFKWDYTFHINEGEAIQRSHSVGGRVTLTDQDGIQFGAMGADQIQVYGAYKSHYTGLAWTYLNCSWNILEPTLTYDLTLQVSGTYLGEEELPPDPDLPFDWRAYLASITPEQAAIVGVVIFGSTIGLAIVARRGTSLGGGYY